MPHSPRHQAARQRGAQTGEHFEQAWEAIRQDRCDYQRPIPDAATLAQQRLEAGHSADADRPRPCSRLVSFERRGSTRLGVRRSLLPSRTLWEDTHGASSHVRSRLLESASDPDLLGVCLAAASGEVCRAAGDVGVGVATLEGLLTDG